MQFIFLSNSLKKIGIQEFTSLMKHQFVVYIYKIQNQQWRILKCHNADL